MRFSFKIFLGLFLIIGFGAYLFFNAFMQSLKPGFRQSTEDALIDVANLLAEVVAAELAAGKLAHGQFAQALDHFEQRRFQATIGTLIKQRPSLQVYVTDARGKVVYDSTGLHVGADFSRWNDVYLTLRGKYGARSTLANPDNSLSSVMHVAAPIYFQQQLLGVLTVQKPNLSVQPFFQAAQRDLTRKGVLLLLLALGAGGLLSWWLSRSIRQLADYANGVRAGDLVMPPRVYGTELQQLAAAMAAMKSELEGKQYVERYVQTLTHQLKTPLASILGAAELLDEDMPAAQQRRFAGNIRLEAQRLQQIVQRMLAQADIENRQSLVHAENIAVNALLAEIVEAQMPAAAHKQLHVVIDCEDALTVTGERFLLQQALSNLLDNAVGFAPAGSRIGINAERKGQEIAIAFTDDGPGIPEFALPRLFERFYSLPRPQTQSKSSGLGLCFVREVARLHGGSIQVGNRHDAASGVRATLTLHPIPT